MLGRETMEDEKERRREGKGRGPRTDSRAILSVTISCCKWSLLCSCLTTSSLAALFFSCTSAHTSASSSTDPTESASITRLTASSAASSISSSLLRFGLPPACPWAAIRVAACSALTRRLSSRTR